jgi:hypothetical protein
MQKNQKFFLYLMASVMLLGLVVTAGVPKVNAFTSATDDPRNNIILDITYNPETQTYSLIGLTEEQLKLLGAPGLEQNVWAILERFDGISLEINNAEINLNTDDAKLATINWDDESREVLYDVIDGYTMQMALVDRQRADEWMEKANVVLTIRNSPDVSNPLVVDLTTLLKVDVSKEGAVAVEGFNTGVALQPDITLMAESGGIDNAAVCWSKSMLKSRVNGNALPQITIHQEGLEVVDKALGLGLGDVTQFFNFQLGASVSFDGAEHLYSECGDW